VAAFIVLLLVLVQFQSTFLDSWLVWCYAYTNWYGLEIKEFCSVALVYVWTSRNMKLLYMYVVEDDALRYVFVAWVFMFVKYLLWWMRS
jgi:hypothetical protein